MTLTLQMEPGRTPGSYFPLVTSESLLAHLVQAAPIWQEKPEKTHVITQNTAGETRSGYELQQPDV